jgi:hypothetical protein
MRISWNDESGRKSYYQRDETATWDSVHFICPCPCKQDTVGHFQALNRTHRLISRHQSLQATASLEISTRLTPFALVLQFPLEAHLVLREWHPKQSRQYKILEELRRFRTSSTAAWKTWQTLIPLNRFGSVDQGNLLVYYCRARANGTGCHDGRWRKRGMQEPGCAKPCDRSAPACFNSPSGAPCGLGDPFEGTFKGSPAGKVLFGASIQMNENAGGWRDQR